MQVFSHLPLSPLFFKHWDQDDTEIGIVLAKARFSRAEDGVWLRAEPAPPLEFEDRFADDPAFGVLLGEQDIAPGKIGTDLTLAATARAPGGQALADWPVSITVPGRLHYGFQVRGPSVWQPGADRLWRRSPPQPVTEVPLTYALAFGGRAPGPEGQEQVHGLNPAGLGLVTPERLALGQPIPVPQIGTLAEFMVSDPLAQMTVQGFGPIAKAWLPRRAQAGSFDESWLRERHPRMPQDYSLRFWNIAPGPLQLDPPLRGDEEITVTGISARAEPVALRLPGAGCALELAGEAEAGMGGARLAMTLDTVALDLRDADPRGHSATLIWRARIPAPHRFATAEVVANPLEG
ncbi:MAG: DUF2169 domain-containing protein [Gemmobacter sp.]|nr:DUF2169 domain-containing protein [Gemmobacter sp.]